MIFSFGIFLAQEIGKRCLHQEKHLSSSFECEGVSPARRLPQNGARGDPAGLQDTTSGDSSIGWMGEVRTYPGSSSSGEGFHLNLKRLCIPKREKEVLA